MSTDPTAIAISDPSNDTRQSQERKLNIVIYNYGIAESKKGTPMMTRVSNDFEAAINALQPLNPSVSEHSIRDCTRLVKELRYRLRQISGEERSYSFLIQRISVAVQRGNTASVMANIDGFFSC